MKKISYIFLFMLVVSWTFLSNSAVAAGKEASIIAHTIPSTMKTGVTYPVSVTVRNEGTEGWTKEQMYRLGSWNYNAFAEGRQYLPDNQKISPNETITFYFNMTAPSVAGTYVSEWRMLQENVVWFGEAVNMEIKVLNTLPAHQATIISENIPETMAKGHFYPVTINVRNDGGDTWSAANFYRLGAVNDNDVFAQTRHLIPNEQSISAGQVARFDFIMQAPDTVGDYLSDWRMVHDGVTWFGLTFARTVRVVEAYRQSAVISNTIPQVMEINKTYNVNITLKNTGNTSWNDSGDNYGQYRLGAVEDNDPFASGRIMIPPGRIIRPGEEYTFTFQMTAPGTPGSFVTDWSMLQEQVTWFGEILKRTVEVIDPARTSMYHYNSAGRLEYVRLTTGKYIYYRYDANGNLLGKSVKQE